MVREVFLDLEIRYLKQQVKYRQQELEKRVEKLESDNVEETSHDVDIYPDKPSLPRPPGSVLGSGDEPPDPEKKHTHDA